MNKIIKILHLEDVPFDAELVARELKKGKINSEILVVDNKPKFERALIDFAPDIIFSDHSLASLDSHEALRLAKKANLDIPFILITATMSDEFAVNVMKLGADDYIIKDRLQRLPSAVINSIEKKRFEREKYISQQHLVQSEARLRESQEIAHVGNWEFNFLTGKVLWSEEQCRIYGVSVHEDELSYETWMSFVHPDDTEYVLTATSNSNKTFIDHALNYRILLKKGVVKFVHVVSKFEIDTFGEPVRLYGITHDVTETKQREVQLRKSEIFNRGVLNSLTSHIAVVDGQGNIVAVNESWKRFALEESTTTLERTGEGSNYFTVCRKFIKNGEAIASELLEGIKDVMDGKREIFSLEYPSYLSNEPRWFSMRIVKFDNDEPMVVVSHQDISERKLAEIERIRITHDLIKRNKALEQFAYIVSHNLRAPVANILGAASLLNEYNMADDEKMKLSRGIYESVTKLDEVVKDINHVLQVKGEMKETQENVRFSDLVDDITISINNLIDSDSILIKYDFSAINEFLTIKSYLYSIFYNLISNSIKYRQQHIASLIEIKSSHHKDWIELNFKDNGMGIDLLKRRDQVFGLYRRFHPNIEGKGMGLFMVKTQVETLGGEISIDSIVNEGTEFKIKFNK